MAIDFNVTNFDNVITDGVVNSGTPTEKEVLDGIKFNSNADSQIVNKFLYNISKAIEYIQNSGAILWQKDKEYKAGSVVNIIELDNGFYNIRKFKYTAYQNSTQPPLIGSISIDPDRLVTYFYGNSTVNSTYWTEIIDKDTYKYNINLHESSKGISLFTIPNTGYYRSNSDVTIKRFNTITSDWDVLKFTFDFECYDYEGNTDNCTLTIYDVLCNNYNRTTYTPTSTNGIYYKPDELEYIFGKNKFTLLGITMSLKNDSLNIDIYTDSYSCVDYTKDIIIEIKANQSNIAYTNVKISSYNGYTGKDVVVIAEGYNNSGTDCGYIVESPVLLSKEELFKKSLLNITESNCMNRATRPGHSKNFDYTFNPDTLYNVVSDVSNKDYSRHVLPRIKGTMHPDGDDSSYRKQYWPDCHSSPLFFGWVDRAVNNRYNVPAHYVSNLYNQNQMKSTVLMDSSNKDDNIFLSKNPELNMFDIGPKLFPRSKRVYRYFKY